MGLATGLATFSLKIRASPMKEWPVPWDWPLFLSQKWPVPWDWPFSKGLETGLKGEVMGSGKSDGTCHFQNSKMASPMGLAILHNFPFQPILETFENGKSNGTCHF